MSSNTPTSEDEAKTTEQREIAEQADAGAESPGRQSDPVEPAADTTQTGSGSAESEAASADYTAPAPNGENLQEPAAETSAGDSSSASVPPAAESAGEEAAAEPPSSPSEPQQGQGAERQRRVQLNPTVQPDQVRAVPSLGTGAESPSPPAASETESETEAEPQKTADVEPPSAPVSGEAAPPPAAAPTEIPPDVEPLGEELEAQIEAALAAEEKPPADMEAAETAETATQPPSEETLERGTRLKGKVQSVHGEDVFFDLGTRSPGLVSRRQFPADKTPEVGQEFDVVVDRVNESEGVIQLNLRRGKRRGAANWDAVSEGQIVDCMVTKTNKGGLEVTVSNLRGFMPASQVDTGYVSDLEQYVGRKLRGVITEANPKKRNLIISRRKYLDQEREAAAEELWKTVEAGQNFTGTVKTIKEYGAFVDIGGADGFLHVGEISWARVNHPADVLSEGQQVDVRVIKVDPERKRISLGMKQLTQNPWEGVAEKYSTGSVISGKVTRTMNFGAFVELEPGVEGLVHISELDYQRVNQVTDVLTVGQEVDLKVLDVDPNRKRIGLSLKQLREKPPELQKPSGPAAPQTPAEPKPQEPKRKDLKGGTGEESGGGGLFGDPRDFQ